MAKGVVITGCHVSSLAWLQLPKGLLCGFKVHTTTEPPLPLREYIMPRTSFGSHLKQPAPAYLNLDRQLVLCCNSQCWICTFASLCQEYIRNKSMQLRILTVNILQKWRSKTSRVGMVTLLLFLRNARIQLLAMSIFYIIYCGEVWSDACEEEGCEEDGSEVLCSMW